MCRDIINQIRLNLLSFSYDTFRISVYNKKDQKNKKNIESNLIETNTWQNVKDILQVKFNKI